jgi:hypothetical protein
MMLELNSKPKKLIVQRHSKSNNWLTEAVMVKSEEETDHRRWTVDEVYYLLETFEIPSDDGYGDLETVPVRILNEHGKVILSTASHDFLIEAGRSGHITVREPIETEDGDTIYKMECYSAKNDAYPHIREFQKFIGRHKGISHVTKYPRNEYDGWEQVWKVYFKDKTFVTVGTHHLYESGGMIISHFAKDKIGY